MHSFRKVSLYAVLSLVAALSCNGCKNNTQPATATPGAQASNGAEGTIAPAQQPASTASQPATTQPAATQPAATQSGTGVATPPPPAGAPQMPPKTPAVDLPAGTTIRVRLDQDLGSKISQPGDNFGATVADDVVVNGQTVIHKGAHAEGSVIDAKPLGKFKGGAYLEVRLDRVHTVAGSYAVSTSSVDRAEKGKGARSAGFIGGGAGVGALIGGLAGGGKGALIGGLAGGGAGTAGGALTGNKQIVLPAETLLTFHLEHAVHISG